MNIIIDGRLLDKKKNTGISRYTEFIIQYYLSKGYKVTLILNHPRNFIKNCSMLITHLKPFNLIHFIYYHRFLNSLSADIVHIPFYSGIFQHLSKGKKTKVITTVHDLMFLLVEDFFGKNKIVNYLKRRYFNFIVKNSVRNSDIVISVSETTKNDLLSIYNINSHVIPEHSELMMNCDDSILSEHSLQSKGYYLYCGNNRPHKNINFIKTCFIKNNIDYPLVLAGHGHSSDNSNIITTGVISDAQLKSLYCNAKAFIFPSSYEGFGLPILESLYCNTPVIASAIPAFAEFNSNNIHLFKINDETSFIEALKSIDKFDTNEITKLRERYSTHNIYKLLDNILVQ